MKNGNMSFCTTEFLCGSEHEVVACYLEQYKEGEVDHINGV